MRTELNGHELETRYVVMASSLISAKNKPQWYHLVWRPNLRRKLRKRQVQLRYDYQQGLVCKTAFNTWNNLINRAL